MAPTPAPARGQAQQAPRVSVTRTYRPRTGSAAQAAPREVELDGGRVRVERRAFELDAEGSCGANTKSGGAGSCGDGAGRAQGAQTTRRTRPAQAADGVPSHSAFVLPEIHIPAFVVPDIQIPSIEIPTFVVPEIQIESFELPEFHIESFELGEFHITPCELQELEVPDLEMEEIRLPACGSPEIQAPKPAPIEVVRAARELEGWPTAPMNLTAASAPALDLPSPPTPAAPTLREAVLSEAEEQARELLREVRELRGLMDGLRADLDALQQRRERALR